MLDKEAIGKIKYMIGKKRTAEEICETLEIDMSTLYETVLELKKNGQPFDVLNGSPVKIVPNEQTRRVSRIVTNNNKKVCILSDIHYGSLYDRPDLIEYIYQLCEEKGIDTILCCGDFTDGNGYRNGERIKNQRVHTVRDMVDYVINIHPCSKNIKLYTISGNHDDSFMRCDGVDILKEIDANRPDIIYLGSDKADVLFDKVKVHMYHGYTHNHNGILESAQKYYDLMPSENHPDILALGHVHRPFYTKFTNTHVFQNGALMDQMPMFEKMGVECVRSCFFADLEYDEEGNLVRVIPDIMEFGKVRVRTR